MHSSKYSEYFNSTCATHRSMFLVSCLFSWFDCLDLSKTRLVLTVLTLPPPVFLCLFGEQHGVIQSYTAAQHGATHHHLLCAQAESGFDTTAAEKRVRLAAVPGGAHRHACIVQALAEFRRLTALQREAGDEVGGVGGSGGRGSRADGPADKTSKAAAYALPSGRCSCFQRMLSMLSRLTYICMLTCLEVAAEAF